MSTPVEEFVSACFDELRISQRFVPYVKKAEEAGYPYLARLFRAMVACETAREALARHGMVEHAYDDIPYYVCPHCGLIYATERPDQCVVDQTPGERLLLIQ